MKREKVAWFYWREYVLPETYKFDVESLVDLVLRIRELDVALRITDRILEADETNINKFSVYIEATNGEVLEKLEIIYDKGEVNVWRIEEKE